MSGRLAISALSVLAFAIAVPASFADKGQAPAKLSFFSGGHGAHAHWQKKARVIEIATTTEGYAGVDVKHVEGTPTEEYPGSSFDVKSDFDGASLGSPRLVVRFSDGGRAELRPLANSTSWETVGDGNWDNNGGTCGFVYQTNWANVQSCHVGTTVTSVFMVADPYGHTHWIDNLDTAGRLFSGPKDNGK